MINHYKLLIVDIDGTLVDKRRAISVEDRKALAKASDSGMKISLCTGRAPQACADIIHQLALDGYHIFFDGALVANPEGTKEVYAQLLNPEAVKQAVEFAHLNNMELDLYSTTRYFVERETWSAIAHREFFNMKPTITDFTKLWSEERIIKIGLVSTSAAEGEKVKNFYLHFNDRFHFSWARTPAYSGVDFINVVAPGVSKGKAMEVLASHLGISTSEVAAIGDGINDIPLLSKAGLAIAMGNAPDEVKAIADYVTLDITQSGLAAAINHYLL